MLSFLGLGIKWDIYHPISCINKVVKELSELGEDNCLNILLIDEVISKKENECWNDFPLSSLDLSRTNIDLLLALNPAGSYYYNLKTSSKVIPCEHPNTLQKQLFVKHRNNYETAVLMDHWFSEFKSNYLDSSNDMPLDPNKLPPGRLPLWVERGVNVSNQEVLDFIKIEHVLEHETVTLLYDEQQKQEIDKICQENGWRSIYWANIYGSEDQVVILLDLRVITHEFISRAKKALIIVSTIG